MDKNNNNVKSNDFAVITTIVFIVLIGTITMTILGYFFFESLFGALSLFTFMFGLIALIVVRSEVKAFAPGSKINPVNILSLILILIMIVSIASLVVTTSWIW